MIFTMNLKITPIIILIIALSTSHSFAISLNPPLIQTNEFKESVQADINTSKSTPDNSWKAVVGPLSSVLTLYGIIGLTVNIARFTDNGEEGTKSKEREGIVLSSVMLALGVTGLFFAISF